MAGIELEGDEIRPTLALSPEEIAALEAERAALRGNASVVAGRKSDRGKIRGEGTALEPEPERVVSIRSRLEAQRAAAGEPITETDARPEHFTQGRQERRKLLVDPVKLAALVADAQRTAEESATADELAESAGAAALKARQALDAYLEESGLAG